MPELESLRLRRVLCEHNGLRFDDLREDLELKLEEDYQLYVKRGSVNEKKSPRKVKEKSILFDV